MGTSRLFPSKGSNVERPRVAQLVPGGRVGCMDSVFCEGYFVGRLSWNVRFWR